MILPNGTLITGREEVAEFHRDWFADPDWSWEPENHDQNAFR